MPAGLYAFADGRTERFATVLAPAGWSYVGERDDGTRTELTVDSRWHPVRCEVTNASWRVRGGAAGRRLLWLRDAAEGGQPVEDGAEAVAFRAASPAFHVVVARLLSLSVKDSAWFRLVTLDEPLLAPLVVEVGWTLDAVADHETPMGPLVVERYAVTDRATGEQHQVHLAGDIVLDAPGVELADLDGPPNQPAVRPGRDVSPGR